jgi:hypothetical protein
MVKMPCLPFQHRPNERATCIPAPRKALINSYLKNPNPSLHLIQEPCDQSALSPTSRKVNCRKKPYHRGQMQTHCSPWCHSRSHSRTHSAAGVRYSFHLEETPSIKPMTSSASGSFACIISAYSLIFKLAGNFTFANG